MLTAETPTTQKAIRCARTINLWAAVGFGSRVCERTEERSHAHVTETSVFRSIESESIELFMRLCQLSLFSVSVANNYFRLGHEQLVEQLHFEFIALHITCPPLHRTHPIETKQTSFCEQSTSNRLEFTFIALAGNKISRRNCVGHRTMPLFLCLDNRNISQFFEHVNIGSNHFYARSVDDAQ